jgi:integrase
MALYRPKYKNGGRSPTYHFDFTHRGRRYKGSTEETYKVEARKVEMQRRDEAKAGVTRREITPITFNDLGDKYLKLHAEGKKGYIFFRTIVRLLKGHFGDREVASISPLDCATFIAGRRRQVKAGTADQTLTVLKQMLSLAEDWGFLANGANPAKKLKLERVKTQRDRYAKPEEIQSLLEACSDWLLPIVTVAVHTGARRGELLGMVWENIDFDRGTILFPDTKNGTDRRIPMNATVRETLQGLPGRFKKSGSVFLQGDKSVNQFMVRRGFHAARKAADLEDLRFHDLRHTWATHLAMAGTPSRTLQKLGGWKDLKMVQRYASVTPDNEESAVNTLDGIFGTPTKSPQAEAQGA